jgi:hypothetical protein
VNVAGWLFGSVLVTVLWVLNDRDANGPFKHFGSHEGNPGDWNPTLWALAVGIGGLIVGIMALRVYFEPPPSEAEVKRELARRTPAGTSAPAGADVRIAARRRLEDVGRLKFHVAAWALGMVVLAPLWALLEWQDNGGFRRWSGDGQPGDWEPWILYVGGIWAGVIVLLALWLHLGRPVTREKIKAELQRLRLHSGGQV